MEAPRLERKLVAILAADVEGYSRHMERDEVATLATFSAHRVIVDELVNSHHGRITGTAGDSVVAEFASVVEAVDCAVKIQDELAAANEALPEEQRLQFRIGINVGDVMVKDGDIFGDGVNIAARLEAWPSRRHLHLARRARPRAQDGPLRLRGSGRADRQEHRPADSRLSRARRDATAGQDQPTTTAPPGAADHGTSDGPVRRQQARPAEDA